MPRDATSDLDLARPRGGPARELDAEEAVAVRGLGAPAVRPRGQLDRALERAHGALHPEEAARLAVGREALPANRDAPPLHLDLETRRVGARHLDHEDVSAVVLHDV